MCSLVILHVSITTRRQVAKLNLTVALQAMEDVELGGGAFLTRITACHVTTYYHVSE